MAFMLMSSHSIGLYDMDMLHGYMLHASSERSGMRTVIPVIDMLMQKQRDERSQQPPWSGRRSGSISDTDTSIRMAVLAEISLLAWV